MRFEGHTHTHAQHASIYADVFEASAVRALLAVRSAPSSLRRSCPGREVAGRILLGAVGRAVGFPTIVLNGIQRILCTQFRQVCARSMYVVYVLRGRVAASLRRTVLRNRASKWSPVRSGST